MLRSQTTREILELIESDGLSDIIELGVHRNQIAQILPVGILRHPGMPRIKQHQTIHPPDLARQHIRQELPQMAKAGILVIDLDHFVEAHLTKCLSHRFGVRHRSGNRRSQQIMLHTDDHRPRFVVEPFGFPQLSGRGRRSAQPGE